MKTSKQAKPLKTKTTKVTKAAPQKPAKPLKRSQRLAAPEPPKNPAKTSGSPRKATPSVKPGDLTGFWDEDDGPDSATATIRDNPRGSVTKPDTKPAPPPPPPPRRPKLKRPPVGFASITTKTGAGRRLIILGSLGRDWKDLLCYDFAMGCSVQIKRDDLYPSKRVHKAIAYLQTMGAS